jgi:hypothetical protein
MPLLASFNGGLSDAQFGGSILFVFVAAIGVGWYCRKGLRGTILGALAGGLPCLWFGFLDRSHRPDFSDILLFLGIPLGGFFGSLAGLISRIILARGPADCPHKPDSVPPDSLRDRAIDS